MIISLSCKLMSLNCYYEKFHNSIYKPVMNQDATVADKM